MKYVKYIVAFLVIVGLVYAGLAAMDAFTPEAFAILSAALLAIIFERFQWIKDAFDQLDADAKRSVMVLFSALLVFGAFGLSCAGKLIAFPCTGDGVIDAFLVFVFTIIANQGVYLVAKRGK